MNFIIIGITIFIITYQDQTDNFDRHGDDHNHQRGEGRLQDLVGVGIIIRMTILIITVIIINSVW